jgi:hypothetical protein
MMLIQHHKPVNITIGRSIKSKPYDDAAQWPGSWRGGAPLMARPHRLKYMRNVLAQPRLSRRDVLTGEEILDWYLAQSPLSDLPRARRGKGGGRKVGLGRS